MKNSITFLLIFLIIFTMHGQSRVNDEVATFSKRSTQIKKIKGWSKNETTRKWIKNKNVIKDKKVDAFTRSLYPQNIIVLELSTISYNDIEYRVLLYETLWGKYKYPNIREDWQRYRKLNYFVINDDDFNKIEAELKIKSASDIIINSNITGYHTNEYEILGGENLYTYENTFGKLSQSIDKPSRSQLCFKINIQENEGKNIVRFRLPEVCRFADNFATNYFELPLEEFKDLFK